MASGLAETLQTLSERIEELARKCAEMQAQIELKDARIATLSYDNSQLLARIGELESDEKFLRVSYRMAQTPDDIISARRLISGLIRNIDKCIADLKE